MYFFVALHESGLVQVFGRRQRRSNHMLRRSLGTIDSAAEKRQGTKSRRWVVRWRCRGRYGDSRSANHSRAAALWHLGQCRLRQELLYFCGGSTGESSARTPMTPTIRQRSMIFSMDVPDFTMQSRHRRLG